MRYTPPEILDVGTVEELTFGGEVRESLDRFTGYRYRIPLRDDEPDETE